MSGGFYNKYSIKPITELGQNITDALDKRSFVLKPYTDPTAWIALFSYMQHTMNEGLKADIVEILKDSADQMTVDTLGSEGIKNSSKIEYVKALSMKL